MSGPASRPRRNKVTIAGLFTLVAIVTGLIYVGNPSPYTMMLWLGLGQGLFFAGVVLFLYVLVKDLRARTDSVTTLRFSQGDVIFKQGEPAERVHVIKRGEVKFVRRQQDGKDQVLGRLGPEMPFGEIAVLSGEGYGATAVAVTEVETLAVDRDGFERIYESVPFIRKHIDTEIGRQVRMVEEKFAGQEEDRES